MSANISVARYIPIKRITARIDKMRFVFFMAGFLSVYAAVLRKSERHWDFESLLSYRDFWETSRFKIDMLYLFVKRWLSKTKINRTGLRRFLLNRIVSYLFHMDMYAKV